MKPTDAIIANGRLVLVGRYHESGDTYNLATNVYVLKNGRWTQDGQTLIAYRGVDVHFPRVRGKKVAGPLKVIGCDEPSFIGCAMAGPFTLERNVVRWTGKRYVEVSCRPIVTPFRVLDDMLGWARSGDLKRVRSRCASARVCAQFQHLAKALQKGVDVCFLSRRYTDYERHFRFEDARTRVDFAKRHGRYVLVRIRAWPSERTPPATHTGT